MGLYTKKSNKLNRFNILILFKIFNQDFKITKDNFQIKLYLIETISFNVFYRR